MTVEATTERVLRLLALLQRRASWTAAELAAELDVTDRSVRRDVERLRALGYPVQATSGVGGGYRLGPAPGCRRCSWTTRRRSRPRCRCGWRPGGRSPARARRRCARSRSSTR
ncbi:helix-turn-helix domain-containing protein [Actinomadura madurae]|nr:helix-turn-helix domain-containing protein [Actinomadura madurae]MCP9980760.1 helix-turn-helix domain-containing protein [Actinomadura madurae]